VQETNRKGQTATRREQRQKPIHLRHFSAEDVPELVDDLIANVEVLKSVPKEVLTDAAKVLLGEPFSCLLGPPSISHLAAYVEYLYDAIPLKVEVTSRIRQLCSEPENVRAIASESVLISALSRTLRDDCSKSMSLGVNICLIFQAISTQRESSGMLLGIKMPEALVKLVNTEIERYKVLYERTKKSRANVEAASDPATAKKLRAEYQEEYMSYRSALRLQDRLFYGSMQTILNLWEATRPSMDLATVFGSSQKLISILGTLLKRNPIDPQLLTLVINFLRQVVADPGNADLVVRAKLVQDIVRSIQPERVKNIDPEELVPLLRLVFNLSFGQRPREQMIEAGVISCIVSLMQRLYDALLQIFREFDDEDVDRGAEEASSHLPPSGAPGNSDSALIVSIARSCPGPDSPLTSVYPQEIVEFLKQASLLLFHYSRVLYNISDTDQALNFLAETQCAQLLISLVVAIPEVPEEAILLLLNCCSHQTMAFTILGSGLLQILAKRFQESPSITMAKVFRNISCFVPVYLRRGKSPASTLDFVPTLVSVLISTTDDALRSELLGCIVACPMSVIAEEDSVRIMRFVKILLDAHDVDRRTLAEAVRLLSSVIGGDQNRRLPDEIVQCLPRFLLRDLEAIRGGRVRTLEDSGYEVALLFCILKACTQRRFRDLFLKEQGFLELVADCLYQVAIPAPEVDPSTASGRGTPALAADRPGERPGRRLQSRVASGRSSLSDIDTASEVSTGTHSARTKTSRLALKSASAAPADQEGEVLDASITGKPVSAPMHNRVKVSRSSTLLKSPYSDPMDSTRFLSSVLAERIFDLLMVSVPSQCDTVRDLRYRVYAARAEGAY